MVKQNKINKTGWEITFSSEKNRLLLYVVYFFRKENIPVKPEKSALDLSL